jgi:sterol carrier protein 2
MSNRTFVIGVGMTKFDKPGTKEGDYPDWAAEAGHKALADAGIAYEDIEQAYAGYVYGDSTYGQRAIYELGSPGSPSSTSTTTARRGRPRCSSRARR